MRNVDNDERIHLGHRGMMNLVPYQLDPAPQTLRQPRSRVLIADTVGRVWARRWKPVC